MLDGLVQTDPHPGNYLVLDSGTNRKKSTRNHDNPSKDNDEDSSSDAGGAAQMGCIDFGQLKRLPLEKRVDLAKAIILMERSGRAQRRNQRANDASSQAAEEAAEASDDPWLDILISQFQLRSRFNRRPIFHWPGFHGKMKIRHNVSMFW